MLHEVKSLPDESHPTKRRKLSSLLKLCETSKQQGKYGVMLIEFFISLWLKHVSAKIVFSPSKASCKFVYDSKKKEICVHDINKDNGNVDKVIARIPLTDLGSELTPKHIKVLTDVPVEALPNKKNSPPVVKERKYLDRNQWGRC